MGEFEVLWGTQMAERGCFATSRTRSACFTLAWGDAQSHWSKPGLWII